MLRALWLVASAVATTRPAVPGRECDRDVAAVEPWSSLDVEPRLWSEASMAAVEAALAARAPALRAPKVFIYPFPEVFANATALVEKAGLSDEDKEFLFFEALKLARATGDTHEGRSGGAAKSAGGAFNLEYVHLAYGVKHWNTFEMEWKRRAGGGLDWTPRGKMVGDLQVTADTHCHFFTAHSQHVLGLVFHRALAKYANVVDDPADADLFFVPDHTVARVAGSESSPSTAGRKAAIERLCAVLGDAWLAHLGTYRAGDGTFLTRRGGRDHVFARNRAWHASTPPSHAKALAQAEGRYKQGDSCCAWSHGGPTKDSPKLWLETQDPYQRSIARHHPVPYLPSVTRSGLSTPGCAFSSADDAERKTFAAAFLGVDVDARRGGDASPRARIHAACAAWDSCATKPFASTKSRFTEAYLNTTFCVNPAGKSAARRGIVDALVAGCVPVLVRRVGVPDTVLDPFDQGDLWPWHWAWQRASSIVVDEDELADVGLRALLEAVPSGQIALMRRVIRANAKSLLWPGVPGGDGSLPGPNALAITLHHLTALSTKDDGNCTRDALLPKL